MRWVKMAVITVFAVLIFAAQNFQTVLSIF
jgi:hypothetical protein